MTDHTETMTDQLDLTDATLDEVVGGLIGLTKVGAGTLSLANAYTGATTVQQGIIAI